DAAATPRAPASPTAGRPASAAPEQRSSSRAASDAPCAPARPLQPRSKESQLRTTPSSSIPPTIRLRIVSFRVAQTTRNPPPKHDQRSVGGGSFGVSRLRMTAELHAFDDDHVRARATLANLLRLRVLRRRAPRLRLFDRIELQ